MPVTSVPSRRGGCRRSQVAEGSRALEHVLPLAANARDLHEVVHHGDRAEADLLGARCDCPEAACHLGRSARPREAPDLQSEAQRHGILRLLLGGEWGGVELSGDHDDGIVRRSVHGIECLVLDRGDRGGHRPELGRDQRRRDRFRSSPVAGPAFSLRSLDEHGMARHPGASSERPHPSAERRLERCRIDHRQQPPGQPLRHDQLENLEGVSAGPQVMAVLTDDGPQVVPGHDRRTIEPARRPRGLARPRRADHDHEARVRQSDRHVAHARCNTPSS